MARLPPMPEDWEDTRATLHAYALAVSALPRTLLEPHPRWWHTSFKVRPDGLTTDPMPVPKGGAVTVRMDLRTHEVVVKSDGALRRSWAMDNGLTASKLGDDLVVTAGDLGLTATFDRERFGNGDPRPYDPKAATSFYDTLEAVAAVFADHRAGLRGEVGPIQLWPNGFDLSFEWFGPRVERSVEDGKVVEHRAQLNLGFYPAGEPYFYSNPWPFDADALVDHPLPSGSEWYVGDWQGTRFPYRELRDDPRATERLLEFAGRVFEVARPTLTR